MPPEHPDQPNTDDQPGCLDADPFTLTPDAPEAPSSKLNRTTLARWQAIYSTGPRQLRRWWKEGAPLDDPASMPAWWERNHTWSIPDRIEAAAAKARASATGQSSPALPSTPSADESEKPSASAPPSSSENASTAAPPGDTPKHTPINIEDFDPEVDFLRKLEQLLAARLDELAKALSLGSHDSAHLETKCLKLSDQVDRMRTRVSERQKRAGLTISKTAVARDLATAAELIRQMGESEARRIIELCPALDPAQRQAVADAVRQLATARARVFRNLSSLKTVADVDQLLAA